MKTCAKCCVWEGKAKCKTGNNPTAEKDLGVRVAHTPNMSQQGDAVVKKANVMLGCMHRSVVRTG